MRAKLKENPAQTDKYTFAVLGLPLLNPTEVSEIEQDTKSLAMPDGTAVTTGNTEAGEFTITIPNHEVVQIAGMDLWVQQGREPVDPLYKKTAVLIDYRVTGEACRTRTLFGAFAKKTTEAGYAMKPDSELAVTKYLISFDSVVSIVM